MCEYRDMSHELVTRHLAIRDRPSHRMDHMDSILRIKTPIGSGHYAKLNLQFLEVRMGGSSISSKVDEQFC